MNKEFQLWEHQQEAVNYVKKEIDKNNGNAIGRVVVPTGGGKTVVSGNIQLMWSGMFESI